MTSSPQLRRLKTRVAWSLETPVLTLKRVERERARRSEPPMTETIGARIVGVRFEDALVFAAKLHVQQCRNGGNVPYVAHLLSVAALVLEDGGDEDEAIAGLLHDAVEDQGGLLTLGVISVKFGDRVAGIVQGCSDSQVLPKPPWL